MKNRTSLTLMEQLVMVLVFALAASLCLSIFARADRISRETLRRDEAVLLAQDGAEVLKSCAGNLDTAAQLLMGETTEKGLQAISGDYLLKIDLVDSGIPGLGQARICVYWEEEQLFFLETGWQEVAQ